MAISPGDIRETKWGLSLNAGARSSRVGTVQLALNVMAPATHTAQVLHEHQLNF